MTGKKIYLQPMDMILNAIHDLQELQKSKPVVCDTSRGFISFRVMIYATEWEYRFTVSDIGRNRCGVTIEIAENAPGLDRLIEHEFALLDYVLIDRAKIELTELEEEEKRIMSSRAH